MNYHILHISPFLGTFYDWAVNEHFVKEMVTAFLRGRSEVKINGQKHRIASEILIYENPLAAGAAGVLMDAIVKAEGANEHFSKEFFDKKFKNATDQFLRGRSWGELKDDLFNILINDGDNKPVIPVVNAQEVQDFLTKWASGETPIWIGGQRIDLTDPKSIHIFGIDLEWLSKDRGSIKASIKAHVDFTHRGKYKAAAFEHFGKDVTDKLQIKPFGKSKTKSSSFDWAIIHPEIYRVAYPRFSSTQYADAVEAAVKELNKLIKDEFVNIRSQEEDGVKLMRQAFSPTNPVFRLTDLQSETDKNIQEGYMQIFAGSMTGIRNPKAHANVEIDELDCWEKIILASHLMKVWDKRII